MENESWLLVFFEVSSFIGLIHNNGNGDDNIINKQDGAEGRFILAKKWTNEFEEKYKNEDWGIDIDYYDTLDEFLENKLKS